jgi:hypothetical protein
MAQAPKPTNGEDQSEALATAIKGEATKYVAKAVIATAAGIIGVAGLGLWIYVKQFLPGLVGGVPPGAVMAFDIPTGCPQGWSTFERGISRTIVGASPLHTSDVPNSDMDGQRLPAHPYQSDGGEERHTLTIEEIPPHDHGIQIVQHSEYVRANNGYVGTDTVGRGAERTDPKWSVRYTEKAGGGRAHNLMPPFIALFYCKKD